MEKIRPLGYVAHSDAHIQSYYASLLVDILERRYTGSTVSDCVLAYRRLDGKCNIDFAFECFEYISSCGDCDVVAMDVKGFFDALDHKHLKHSWSRLLKRTDLPNDHYKVFRSVTNDSAITLPTLRDIFGGSVARRLGKTGQRICDYREFRELIKPRLRRRHEVVAEFKHEPIGSPRGIPQGTPISAVLANLYMLDADAMIQCAVADLNGIYRRYSDDILLIVPPGSGRQAEQTISEVIRTAKLEIQSQKTERRIFRRCGSTLECFSADPDWNLQLPSKFGYLGFAFDGREIRIRDSSIARFIDRMNRHVRRAMIAAAKREQVSVKRRQLYAKLSELGWGAAYGDWEDTEGPPKQVPRMGFHKYLRHAARKMKSDRIERQGRQLTNLLYRTINEADRALRK